MSALLGPRSPRRQADRQRWRSKDEPWAPPSPAQQARVRAERLRETLRALREVFDG